MNRIKIRMALCASAVLLSHAVLCACAQTGPIAVRVERIERIQPPSSTMSLKGQTLGDDPITKRVRLDISISNLTQNQYTNLTVRYYLFASDAKEMGKTIQNRTTTIVGKGEKTISLSKLGATSIQSEQVSTTYTPQHSKISGGGGSRSTRSGSRGARSVGSSGKVTTVPASGTQFVGFGVQVWQNDAMLAEQFEPSALKKKVGGK